VDATAESGPLGKRVSNPGMGWAESIRLFQ
jgi:hypothetical protein